MKIVTAAIIRHGKNVLLARRGVGQKHEGFWEFPGGKLEPDETPQDCLRRELQEELGVDSTVGKIVCSSKFEYENGVIELLALEAVLTSDQIVPSVHDRIEWIRPGNLLDYNLLPADVPIATFLLETERIEV